MPTDGWRLVALEDGSSSSSDPEEAAMKKKQGVGAEDNDAPSAAEQFYSLAVEAPHRQGQPALSSP